MPLKPRPQSAMSCDSQSRGSEVWIISKLQDAHCRPRHVCARMVQSRRGRGSATAVSAMTEETWKSSKLRGYFMLTSGSLVDGIEAPTLF